MLAKSELNAVEAKVLEAEPAADDDDVKDDDSTDWARGAQLYIVYTFHLWEKFSQSKFWNT